MMGRHHIIVGSFMAAPAVVTVMKTAASESIAAPMAQVVMSWCLPQPSLLFVVLAVVLFVVGCVAPDADQRHSLAGRWVHLPLVHRGWTHTVWALGLVTLVSLWEPTRYLWAMSAGMLTHCLLDSVSRAGVVWGYPFTRYKVITVGSGSRATRCVVKPGYRRGWYKASARSEDIVAWGISVVCAVVTALVLMI